MNKNLEKAIEQMTESRIYIKDVKDGKADYLPWAGVLDEKQEELFGEIMRYGNFNAFDVDEYVKNLK